MRFICVLWFWTFISEFKTSTTDEVSTQGYKGRNITITCSHKWASDNIKYFCRDPCKDTEVLVKSDQSPKGRYTLKNTGHGVFTVTITDLQKSDSGVYWCGVERVGLDTFNQVTLTVSEGFANASGPDDILTGK
ncbi:CMRF35-like molecule 1 [Danio aesculapii]|uniref:CMRF35-like molecule 1 n=1 Tax=Danio aesculapii TaxID=1142201 RepID=UPI0024BF8E14|nr:CMRF35-like molecule 1 [Danio aesculapii]